MKISGSNGPFTANTKFRFRCDASGNSDWIYLDDVVIWGYTCGPTDLPQETQQQVQETDFSVYPNPVSQAEELRIEASQASEVNTIEVFNLTGQLLQVQDWDKEKRVMDISLEGMRTGTYFLKLHTEQGVVSKKFIVIE